MRTHISNKKRAAAVMAALTIITLTACGSGSGDGSGQAGVAGAGAGNVASLPASPGQGTSSAGTTAGQSGPAGLEGVTLPDNASPAETARIMNAWASCMGSHGDHGFAVKRGDAGGPRFPTVNFNKFPAALKACRSLRPHPPWQELSQYNPNYQRDFARWVNCLNARGLPVKAIPGGWTFNGTSSLSAAQQEKVTVQCEMQAFNES